MGSVSDCWVQGRGIEGWVGVLVEVDTTSDSSVAVAWLDLLAEFRADLRRLRFAWVETAGRSSPPLVASSASLILSPSAVKSFMRATERSPPETVLLRPSLTRPGCGDVDGEGNAES